LNPAPVLFRCLFEQSDRFGFAPRER
jgi:hypothetical protein